MECTVRCFRELFGRGGPIFFYTDEKLTSDDLDQAPDLYERTRRRPGVSLARPIEDIVVHREARGAAARRRPSHLRQPREADRKRHRYLRRPLRAYQRHDDAAHTRACGWERAVSRRWPRRRLRRWQDRRLQYRGSADERRHRYPSGRLSAQLRRHDQVSQGPIGGNAGRDASLASADGSAVSADASAVIFSTAEKLTGDDVDGVDLYKRANGVTTLLSRGVTDQRADFAGASADTARVFFTTAETLTADDLDSQVDIYQWTSNGISRLSRARRRQRRLQCIPVQCGDSTKRGSSSLRRR